jgi:hypothetical protein
MEYASNENLYHDLSKSDILPGQLRAGFGDGRYIDPKDHKWHAFFRSVDHSLPWIQTNPNPDLYCLDYHAIVDGYGFIPKKCLECYKVVVSPRSFHELMQLLDLQKSMVKENPKCWCKCGVEMRDFVPRNYGGYFYTRGLEQGRIRYRTVRDAVDDAISKDVPVLLKRYCTEFEFDLGPSNLYKQPEGADKIEKMFWDSVDCQQEAVPQPDFVQRNIIRRWIRFAWGRGDSSVIEYNNGKSLYPSYVTYHEGA